MKHTYRGADDGDLWEVEWKCGREGGEDVLQTEGEGRGVTIRVFNLVLKLTILMFYKNVFFKNFCNLTKEKRELD